MWRQQHIQGMENRAIQGHCYWTEPREPGVKGWEFMGNVIEKKDWIKHPETFPAYRFWVICVWPLSGKLLCDDFQK